MEHLLSTIFEVFNRIRILYFGIIVGWLFIISPLKRYKSIFIKVTINLVVPIIIFISMLTINFGSNIVFYPLIGAILVTIIGIIGPKIIARITNQEEPTPAEICTATFPNALNFPFPIIFQFAPLGLGIASLFVALTTITRNSIGFWISGTKVNREAAKKILTFPVVWGIIAGIGTNILFYDFGITLSQVGYVQYFLQFGIFLTIMTVGFSLEKPSIEYIQPIFRVSIVRFVIMGIIGIIILLLFKPEAFIAITLFVQLTAPPAVVNGIYAEELDLDTELTSQLIVTLTFIALLILPLQLLFIQFIS